MRFIGQALLASVFVLGACAGGDKSAASSDTAAAPAAATPAAAPADSSASTTTSATSAAAPAAPITGQIHEVDMVGDEKGGYRFQPADLTIKQGDGVKFVMKSGGPHNVAFDSTSIPAGAAAKLDANMTNKMASLQGNFLMNTGDSYTISFAGLPKGVYHYHCMPHMAMNMVGTITVQ